MSYIANWLARLIWRAVLWLMRRNWMKGIQRKSILIVPKSFREQAWKSQVRQNRFARRTGLPMLKFMMNLVLGSIIITVTFLAAMRLYESGFLTMPWQMRHRLMDSSG